MAIQQDSASVANNNSTASLTWSHTVAGVDRLLLVVASYEDETGAFGRVVTGITYNGVALTFLARQDCPGFDAKVDIWYLVNPATGANNVVVTLDGACGITGMGVSYTGVFQERPLGSPATASGNSTGPSVVVPLTHRANFVFDGLEVFCGASIPVILSDTNIITFGTTTGSPGDDSNAGLCSEDAASIWWPGSATMSYTMDSARAWAIVGVEIIARVPVRDPVLSPAGIVPWSR